ncbi:MAG: M67 family metallopeptidase [Nitrospiria bacterium]
MIHIPKEMIDTMILHANSEKPNECCGLLAGKDRSVTEIHPISNLPAEDPSILDLNVPSDRRFRYVMDPKEQIACFKKMRENGTELLSIYHSHPASPAYPSATDVRLAFYPDVHYVIISLEKHDRPVVRAFRIVEEAITEEAISGWS